MGKIINLITMPTAFYFCKWMEAQIISIIPMEANSYLCFVAKKKSVTNHLHFLPPFIYLQLPQLRWNLHVQMHLWKEKSKTMDANLHCSSYRIKLSPLTNGHKEYSKIAVSM